MNDHELHARLRRLREPAVDEDAAATALRRSLSALGEGERDDVPASAAVSPWTWRDWLWPSPLAWGTLTTVWVAIFAIGNSATPAAQSRSAFAGNAAPGHVEPSSNILLAHQAYRELLRKYQQTSKLK